MALSGYLSPVRYRLRVYQAMYRKRSLLKKVKSLSQRLVSAYEHGQISWVEYDGWMEDLWAAADHGECE
jgi:hypothetical protein